MTRFTTAANDKVEILVGYLRGMIFPVEKVTLDYGVLILVDGKPIKYANDEINPRLEYQYRGL